MRALLLLITRDIHQLEYDPATQYRFHFISAWFWFGCMLAVPFVPSFRTNLLSLLIMEASLWANFATHFGSMSAALAAKQTSNPTPKKQPETSQPTFINAIHQEITTERQQTNQPNTFDF